jgi:hypothetical protein
MVGRCSSPVVHYDRWAIGIATGITTEVAGTEQRTDRLPISGQRCTTYRTGRNTRTKPQASTEHAVLAYSTHRTVNTEKAD